MRYIYLAVLALRVALEYALFYLLIWAGILAWRVKEFLPPRGN